MLKHTMKNVVKKSIRKTCGALPERGKRWIGKCAQHTLNALGLEAVPVAKTNGSSLSMAVRVQGGIGDSLIAFAWIKELHRHTRKKIDMHVFGRMDVLNDIAAMLPFIHAQNDISLYPMASGYDIKASIGHFIHIDYMDAEKIRRLDPELVSMLQKCMAFSAKYFRYSSQQPYFDGAWASLCTLRGWNRWDELGASGAVPFSRTTSGVLHLDIACFEALRKFALQNRPFITIHAGNDSHTRFTNKIWPVALWNAFCDRFREAYPDTLIVQIGAKNEQFIEKADISLCGKANFAETMIVLKQALLHVDGESGFVHARHILGGQSAVIFGPTPVEYFRYDGNADIVSPACANCMWMTEDWGYNCPRGFARPECMYAVTPESVLEHARGMLDGKKPCSYALDAHEVYSSEGRLKYYETLKDICATCHLELKPISEHITGEAGTYIHASKQWEYPFAVRNIESMNKTPLRIADVGGGRGALSGYLARQGHHVAVYDVNYLWDHGGDRDIENAFFRFAEKTGFSADYGSVFNIPVPDETFDVVACISVLEHVPYKEYALKELLRVLKRNGKLILTYDFVLENPVDRDALRVEIFTPETLAHELSSLSIQEIPHSMEEIRKSLNDIKADNVNIADDMTVAGLVIIKR